MPNIYSVENKLKKKYPNINTFILTAYCYDKNCKLAKEYGASYS